jgi:hypothetical protein
MQYTPNKRTGPENKTKKLMRKQNRGKRRIKDITITESKTKAMREEEQIQLV